MSKRPRMATQGMSHQEVLSQMRERRVEDARWQEGRTWSLVEAEVLAIGAELFHGDTTATIFGPAFIGPVARALRNRERVVSGLTTGLMGFAVGTYLGLAVAWLLRP